MVFGRRYRYDPEGLLKLAGDLASPNPKLQRHAAGAIQKDRFLRDEVRLVDAVFHLAEEQRAAGHFLGDTLALENLRPIAGIAARLRALSSTSDHRMRRITSSALDRLRDEAALLSDASSSERTPRSRNTTPDSSSVLRGRRLVLTLGSLILGLHTIVLVAYGVRFGLRVAPGFHPGSQSILVWICFYLMYVFLFGALYVRQRWARWVLIVCLVFVAVTQTPTGLAKWRQGEFKAVLAGGMAIALYLAVAANLLWSRNLKAYLAAQPATGLRRLGIVLLLFALLCPLAVVVVS